MKNLQKQNYLCAMNRAICPKRSKANISKAIKTEEILTANPLKSYYPGMFTSQSMLEQLIKI